jgi:hypothetical protein
LKRYSFISILALAFILAIAFSGNALAGEKCHDGKAKTASCSKAACAKDCKDTSQCAKACDTKACTDKGQCAGSCKVACTDKAACTAKNGAPCKPGECKPSDCKVAPGK